MRNSGVFITDCTRHLAIQERFIDLACVFLYGKPHLPIFLSRTSYFGSVNGGVIIPVHFFEDFSEENDTLSEHLARPLLNLGSMNAMIERLLKALARKESIYALRTRINEDPKNA